MGGRRRQITIVQYTVLSAVHCIVTMAEQLLQLHKGSQPMTVMFTIYTYESQNNASNLSGHRLGPPAWSLTSEKQFVMPRVVGFSSVGHVEGLTIPLATYDIYSRATTATKQYLKNEASISTICSFLDVLNAFVATWPPGRRVGSWNSNTEGLKNPHKFTSENEPIKFLPGANRTHIPARRTHSVRSRIQAVPQFYFTSELPG